MTVSHLPLPVENNISNKVSDDGENSLTLMLNISQSRSCLLHYNDALQAITGSLGNHFFALPCWSEMYFLNFHLYVPMLMQKPINSRQQQFSVQSFKVYSIFLLARLSNGSGCQPSLPQSRK